MTDQQQTTHFAVPAQVFAAALKTLGTMPYDQVDQLMQALKQQSPGIHIDPKGGEPTAATPAGGPAAIPPAGSEAPADPPADPSA